MTLRPRCGKPLQWGPCDIHAGHPFACATSAGQYVGRPPGGRFKVKPAPAPEDAPTASEVRP